MPSGRKTTFRGICQLLLAACVLIFGIVDADATPTGFATDYGTGANTSLYRLDFGASTSSLIGTIGFGNVTGLAIQPGTGTLFGVDHNSDSLVTINTTTGAGTLVGALGVNVFDLGLAFDAAGNLFMTSDDPTPNLYSVNVGTGAATFIGSTGTAGVTGLDFSSTGTLYGLYDTPGNSLVTLNTGTGAATIVGTLGFDTNTSGIGFDNAGNLWGAFGFVNPGLTTINPNTGGATAPIDLGIDFAGLAMQPIPEPSTWLLLGSGLISLLEYGRRRKKRD